MDLTARRPDRENAHRLEAWLRARSSAIQLPLAGAALAGGAVALLTIAQAWFLARIIDAVVIHGRTLAEVLSLVPWLVGAIMLRAVFAGLAPVAAFSGAARIRRDLRHRLHVHMAALGPAWTRRQRSGDLANTLVDGVEKIEKYYADYLPQRLLAVFVPVAVLIAVVPADWLSAAVLCITAPLIPLFMAIVGKGAEALSQRQWRSLARMSAHVFDMIEGLTTLKVFNASRRQAAIVANISEAYRHSTMQVLRVAFLSSLVLEFFAMLSIALVAVFIGFRLYYGQMSFLPGFFVLLLAPEFYRPLRDIGAHYHARMAAIAAAERIVGWLETPCPETGARRSLARAPLRIAFDGVTFLHAAGQGVADISFTLAAGECLMLTGPSGAGKTTLADLLLGFLTPQHGMIRVNGADFATLSEEAWLGRVAWLPQAPTLFHGTILDNIRLGVPDASPDAVRAAAEAAAAHEFIAALPNGYLTRIGEGGDGLSGGERRRVALARALLKPADLLVLDEPTAALDRDTAARVIAAIRQRARTSAVLLITHDMETLRAGDRVLRVAHGRVQARCPEGIAVWPS